MCLLKYTRPRAGWKCLYRTSALLLVLVGNAFLSQAQEPQANAVNQELTVTDLLTLPGKVLGEGVNKKAVGKFKVARYRVEEIALPRVQEVEIRGEKFQTTRAFRVILIGGPFPVRAKPPVIWIDEVAVGYGVENEDLTEIAVVTYDPALLREAATLYLSYGNKTNREDRVAVPEKLKLAGAKGGQQ
jgi:hypothetical protein